MAAKPEQHWRQFSLRKLIALATVGPPIAAGGAYLVSLVDAPPLAVALSIAQVAFWLVILVCVGRNVMARQRSKP